MTSNDKKLLLSMMEDYSDRLGNDSCNDWMWPKEWSLDYRKDFLTKIASVLEDGSEYDYHPTYGPADFIVWDYLKRLVELEIETHT